MPNELKIIICGALAFFVPTLIGFAYQYFVRDSIDSNVMSEDYTLVDSQITPDNNIVIIQDNDGKTYKISVDTDTYTKILTDNKNHR